MYLSILFKGISSVPIDKWLTEKAVQSVCSSQSIWQLLPMGRGRRLNNWSEYGESSLGLSAHREPQLHRATCDVVCGLSCSEKLCSGASSARVFEHGLVC